MNILIASDSYKGSLSSLEVAEQIGKGIKKVIPEVNIINIPIADGGEGTVKAIITSMGGRIERCRVAGPMGNEVIAEYGILKNGNAVIEMASASGLPLVQKQERNVLKATTFGTGQLIKSALDKGCKEIYIGIGGSATNDGGVGMAQALGGRFIDHQGNEVGFGGEALKKIVTIDLKNMDDRLKNTKIIVMSDVTNVLCGPAGAAAVYGPQKGASDEDIKILDEGLKNLAGVVKLSLGKGVLEMKSGGAAGGLGMGLFAFAGAEITSGIDAILKMIKFDEKLKWADLVITGEGRMDEQSVNGKVPVGISKRASDYNVPVIAIVGCIGKNADMVYQHHIESMESCVSSPCTLEEALENSKENLAAAAERLIRTIMVGMKLTLNK